MGFLSRAAKGEEFTNQNANEELYQKLFPKIGRDFVHREDLVNILKQILAIIDPAGIYPIDYYSDIEARKRALEYKALLESGNVQNTRYKDLIDLDE